MKTTIAPHWKAVLQALFVTLLWATSWVLIKIGLADVPSITFGGLRYFIAFLFMALVFIKQGGLATLRTISKHTWVRIVLVGVFYYALTQGAQYFGLGLLPAVTVNLLLGLSSIIVALLGIKILHENLSRLQWLGVILSPMGAFIYFYPAQFPADRIIGIAVVVIGLISGAIGSILSRDINRSEELSPIGLTTLSMGVGSIILLSTGVAVQGLPIIPFKTWVIIIWMAIVNTAFAFTLWNHTMRTLTAIESSMINNTMMVQVPILAIIFLGESITPRQIVGMVVTITGVALVQFFRKAHPLPIPQDNDPGLETG